MQEKCLQSASSVFLYVGLRCSYSKLYMKPLLYKYQKMFQLSSILSQGYPTQQQLSKCLSDIMSKKPSSLV